MNGLTWYSETPEPQPDIPPSAWPRVIVKGVLLAGLVFGGLAILLLVRLVERPLHGISRPWTPHITVFVCRQSLAIIGMKWRQNGSVMEDHGAIVSNHVSWLDVFALNAAGPVYFVSKSEVAGWPGIGWLARATGTVFIRRARAAAAQQRGELRARLDAGHRLLFFPEGTSTDGLRVLPFKSTIFAALAEGDDFVQPVTLNYRAPDGQIAAFYGWWGNMTYGAHLLRMLAAKRHGSVTLDWHDPIPPTETVDRKALATRCEDIVRDGLQSEP